MSTTDKITLKTSDNETFQVEKTTIIQSQTIKQLIDAVEQDCVENVIPLANVDSKTLTKVIEYCERYSKAPLLPKDWRYGDHPEDKELKAFDEEFIKTIDLQMLVDLILAANYLDIKRLLGLTCKQVADMMTGKSAAEVREMFQIENDFTPEEEEELRRQDVWAFEDVPLEELQGMGGNTSEDNPWNEEYNPDDDHNQDDENGDEDDQDGEGCVGYQTESDLEESPTTNTKDLSAYENEETELQKQEEAEPSTSECDAEKEKEKETEQHKEDS